ncbi:MAG: hypothetical protein QXI50_05850, partial [Candidatus Caldarchaeum sp.]
MDLTPQNEENMMKQVLSISSLALLGIIAAISPVSAVEAGAGLTDLGSKTFAAAIAFAVAVASSGFGIARAGSAGLAAAAERPEIRTTAIIISAFAEALAIYGIVVAF